MCSRGEAVQGEGERAGFDSGVIKNGFEYVGRLPVGVGLIGGFEDTDVFGRSVCCSLDVVGNEPLEGAKRLPSDEWCGSSLCLMLRDPP